MSALGGILNCCTVLPAREVGPVDSGQTRMHLLALPRKGGILALKVLISKKISFKLKLNTHPRLKINFDVLRDAHGTPRQVKVKSVNCRAQRQKFRSPY